jgi:hypothetical protein
MTWYKPEEFKPPIVVSEFKAMTIFAKRDGFLYGVRWKCMILHRNRVFSLETTNYDRVLSFITRSIEEDIPCKIYEYNVDDQEITHTYWLKDLLDIALESGKFFIEENSGGNIDVG